MKLSVIGSGYVGTTVAACLAELGHEVVNVDVDDEVVASINDGVAPIHEPRLGGLVEEGSTSGALRATTEYGAVRDTDVTFVCLPTPTRDGSVDLSAVEAGIESLADALGDKEHVVAVKSTVPPGTAEDVVAPRLGENVGVASNPEFLSEGTAVDDFMNPDKVVVGDDEGAREPVLSVYEPLLGRSEASVVETGNLEAEMIKYSNNAFLASKVSLVNELGNICKELGIDAYEVMDAVGEDDRVSSRFTRSGLGWGGSCFPKDVDALRSFARDEGYEPALLDAVVEVNDRQPRRAVELLSEGVETDGARVAVLGLAFKPGTDDVRGSRGIEVARLLREEGADVVAYDPRATENARAEMPGVEYAESAEEALEGAGAAVIATDWEEFEGIDASGTVVVDGRRIEVKNAEAYEGLCW